MTLAGVSHTEEGTKEFQPERGLVLIRKKDGTYLHIIFFSVQTTA